YLDLVSMDSLAPDIEIAWKVIRYKTAKYTFERPLQLGARLAGANNDQLDALSAYSIPLGEAFQLRDDLLGVFGNPATTGKSALDDLREGKITVLVATAYRLATPAEARRLDAHLGNPRLDDKGADECRDIFTSTGAAASVERMITERLAKAMDSLENGPLRPSIIPVLRALASVAANRVE
ncbi:polyprenyl synthetase family protein, partial [Parafrankia sp. FMc6]|uniref:polyprenyl synthetase family protein n=1 Tax=Parafrankia soli TaxID=2599596 RepID=UPI0034D4DDBD